MSLKSLLRSNTRHTLWFPRGYKGKVLPQLNPIMSSSHGANNKRTWSFTESLWLFKLRQRLFAFAGKQRCGRRDDSWMGTTDEALPDTWDIGPDGNRTCSYCGSIHFDDLMKIVERSLTDERYSIDTTDKSYKVYVRQPNVRNAGEGAIKYYKHHTPIDVTPEQKQLFNEAVHLSSRRFYHKMRKQNTAA